MKQNEILQILSLEFGTQNILELNKLLKSKVAEKIKFKIRGQELGPLGYTVVIKAITEEGLKIYDVNRVRLIRFSEMESFEKAPAKVPRPASPKKPKPVKAKAHETKPSKRSKPRFDDEDDEDHDFDVEDDEEDFKPKRKKRPGKSGSFIPKK